MSSNLEIQRLEERVKNLEEENDKLRQVEDQFWILLREREQLLERCGEVSPFLKLQQQKQLQESNGPRCGHCATLQAVVSECLELLIAKDRGGSITSANGGPVAAFLTWYSELYEGGSLRKPIENEGHSTKTNRTTIIAFDDRESLIQRVKQLERESEQLQEELDRADVSRIQALEDAERLQKHISALSEKLSLLRNVAETEKERADRHASGYELWLAAKAQMAERDNEIARLKNELDRIRRLSSVGGAELAADAARIREELASRARTASPFKD